MTLSIICAFIGCWTPYFVVHLIHIWSEYSFVIADYVYAFAETLALLNSAINPILYGCFNVQLKRSLAEMCCPGTRSTADSTHRRLLTTRASNNGRSSVNGLDMMSVAPRTDERGQPWEKESRRGACSQWRHQTVETNVDERRDVVDDDDDDDVRLRIKFLGDRSGRAVCGQ